MAHGRKCDTWERTSWVVAKLHNVNCVHSHHRVEPREVNPMWRGPRTGGGQQTSADFNASFGAALDAAEKKERGE